MKLVIKLKVGFENGKVNSDPLVLVSNMHKLLLYLLLL